MDRCPTRVAISIYHVLVKCACGIFNSERNKSVLFCYVNPLLSLMNYQTVYISGMIIYENDTAR